MRAENVHYHSVEFHVGGLKLLYQSKLWRTPAKSMFTLIREDSDILNRIHVGDILSMKYYSEKKYCPPQDLDTEIKYIERDQQGRFKGHFLVGLGIIPNHMPNHIDCVYHQSMSIPDSMDSSQGQQVDRD